MERKVHCDNISDNAENVSSIEEVYANLREYKDVIEEQNLLFNKYHGELSNNLGEYKEVIEKQNVLFNKYHSELSNGLKWFKTYVDNHNNTVAKSIDTLHVQYNEISHSNFKMLENAISTVPDGAYLLEIISGIVVAVVIVGINFWHLSRVNKKNSCSHYTSTLLVLVKEFEELALDYWMKNKTNRNKTEMILSEFKMKSEFSSIQETVKFAIPLIDKVKDRDALTLLTSQLYDISTGGEFESSSRKMNKSAAQKISRLCTKIKVILIRYDSNSIM